MARCQCAGGGGSAACNCAVAAGRNVQVRGTGAPTDPYVIDATAPVADGSETKVRAGANIQVTGTGTAADPYTVTGRAARPPDGSETKVAAGRGAQVTGKGTTAEPYVVAVPPPPPTVVRAGANIQVSGTGTAADPYTVIGAPGGAAPDGSETKVTAGRGAQVTGTGTTANPYVVSTVAGGGVPPDGSETRVTAGAGVSVRGTGTRADPYVVGSQAAAPVVADGLTGDGTAAAPLRVRAAPLPVCAPMTLPVLVGANGDLRVSQQIGFLRDVAPGPLVTISGTDWCRVAPTAGNQKVVLAAPHFNQTALTIDNPSRCCNLLVWITMQGRLRIDFPVSPVNYNSRAGVGMDALINNVPIARVQYVLAGYEGNPLGRITQDGDRYPIAPQLIPAGGSIRVGWQVFATGEQPCRVTHVRYNAPRITAVGFTVDC